MSEEEKREDPPPREEEASPEEAPPSPPKEAPKAPKKTAPPAAAPPMKEKMMAQSHKEGAGNFLAMMALAVALGSLLLTAFFAYAKGRPAAATKLVAEFQKTTTQEVNALNARVIDLEAAVQELKALRGRAGDVDTLDLKKSLVSLREVGRQTTGDTRKRVEQVEGALKALINELEAKGQ